MFAKRTLYKKQPLLSKVPVLRKCTIVNDKPMMHAIENASRTRESVNTPDSSQPIVSKPSMKLFWNPTSLFDCPPIKTPDSCQPKLSMKLIWNPTPLFDCPPIRSVKSDAWCPFPLCVPKTQHDRAQRDALLVSNKKHHTHVYMCYIGMDLSIHSPGVVCRIQINNKTHGAILRTFHYHFIFFAKTKIQESSGSYLNGKLHLHHLPIKCARNTFRYDIDWYAYIAREFMSVIDTIVQSYTLRPKDIFVVIEDYAFRKKDTSSLTKLCEAASLVKLMVRDRKYKFKLYSNTTVKKHFSGNGHADKHDMWVAFAEHFPDMSEVFETHFQWDYEDAKDRFEKRQRSKSIPKRKCIIQDKDLSWLNSDTDDETHVRIGGTFKRRKLNPPSDTKKEAKLIIPHPLEDLVDALGLVYTHVMTTNKR